MRGVVGETVLGRYRLESRLAEGGFGQVWSARQVSLDRPVALKVLRPGRREDPSIRERFRREARALAAISHPHVVTCHDFDVDPDGDLVLVMEYLEGCTLQDLFRRGQMLPLTRVVNWISQAAEGLWEAHARGIVHRDVKPSNLFVADCGSRRERLKVIDFGILRADLRAHPDLQGLTRTGMVVGTPEYLAPEVALGRPADACSDQYGLALVAFELIAMRRAFPGWEEGGGMARMWGRPEGMDFAETGRRVPPAVREVLWRALSPTPEERHATIRDFGAALREAAGLDDGDRETPTRVAVSVGGGSTGTAGTTETGGTTRTGVTRVEPSRPRSRLRTWGLPVLAGVLAATVLGGIGLRSVAVPERAVDSFQSIPGWTGLTGPDDAAEADGGELPGTAGDEGGGMAAAVGPEVPAEPPVAPAEAEHRRSAGDSARAARRMRDSGVAAPTVPEGSGRLSLNAMPWAEVFLDDRFLGRTPIRDLEVPAGVHRLRFVHPSLGEVRRTVQVPAGGTGSLAVDLKSGAADGR